MKGTMKKILVSLLLLAAPVFAGVPGQEIQADSQHPGNTWTLKTFAGATPKIIVDLKEAGADWPPSSDWSGFFWYGTNSDWTATSAVQIAGVFATNLPYITCQALSNSFPAAGTYYGGVVMTNATQTFEWGRGYVQVLASGGITASGILDLRVNSGLYAPLAHVSATGTNVHGHGTASTNNTGDFATAAEGDNGQTAFGWGNHATNGYISTSGMVRVTGTLSPDAKGYYYRYSAEQYLSVIGSNQIDSIGGAFWMLTAMSNGVPYTWQGSGASVFTTYAPMGGSGTATVTAVSAIYLPTVTIIMDMSGLATNSWATNATTLRSEDGGVHLYWGAP